MRLLPATWFVCKNCARCLGSLLVWSLWLVLGLLLIFQLRIAVSHELTVPGWLIHKLETRQAAHGLVARFGSATVDPRGRIFLRDAQFFSTAHPEPLLTARTIDATLNPWAILAGDFGATDLDVHGAELHLPPILSPSGRDEAILTDINFSLHIDDNELAIQQFAARCASLTIAARGTLQFPPRQKAAAPDSEKLIGLVFKKYFEAARLIAANTHRLDALESPHLDIVLTPDSTRAAFAHTQFSAAGAHLPRDTFPHFPAGKPIDLGPFTAETAVPLLLKQSWPARIQIAITALRVPDDAVVRDARLRLAATLLPGWKLKPDGLDAAVSALSTKGVQSTGLVARITGSPADLHADIGVQIFDEPWTITAAGDTSARSGTIALAGRLQPSAFAFASQRAGHDLGALLQPATPPPVRVTVELGPEGHLARVSGHLASGPIVVRKVPLDATAADFALQGTDLHFDRILLLTGDSEARGSYSMDTHTREFRFLLNGRLRPPAIDGWFGEWWPGFWSHFDFTHAGPPAASVEVAGLWGKPRDTVVFVHADAADPTIQTVPFDHVRTTLFIRPGFFDGLELVATRGPGTARGTFTRSLDLEKNALRFNTFDVITDLDPVANARVFGKVGTDIVAPFVFQRPPHLKISGRLDGPAAPDGEHQHALVELESTGPFTFFGFPLSNLSTRAVLADDDLKLDNLRVGFARGYVTGRARMSGKGEQRRLGFDAFLENASLGQAIEILEDFGAYRKNLPPPAHSEAETRLEPGRLSLRLSGDGDYQDPYTFIGSGSGEIADAELAQIKLLGGLSDVLRAVRINFTSLRLTAAQANFKLNKRELDFSELKITGPAAVVDLTGKYRLDLQQMDFNAKVSPYELSRNPLANAVDLVLTPFSNILELKLSGSLDNPRWRFAYGPSSLLRSLAGKKSDFHEPPSPSSPSPSPARELLPPPSLRRR